MILQDRFDILLEIKFSGIDKRVKSGSPCIKIIKK